MGRRGGTDRHGDCIRGFPSHIGNLAEKEPNQKKNKNKNPKSSFFSISFLKELGDLVAGQEGACPS